MDGFRLVSVRPGNERKAEISILPIGLKHVVHVSLRSDQLQNLVQFLFRVPVTERIQVQRRCVFIGNDGHTAHLRAVQEQRKGVVFLLFGGMNLYDALLHAFSTAGTGGFSNRAASVSFYDSAYIDGVITVFMILFGINFNLYFFILLKDWKSILKNEELWAYLGIVGVSIAIITGNILKIYGTVAHAFRYASFQVGSIITTTGFATADYDQWPELSKSILLALMFVGACAGSTGGGIKVSRLLIIVKSIRREVRKMLHPNAVTIIKVNGKKIGQDTLKNVNLYLTCYIMILIVSILLVSIDNFDFATTFSGVLTTMSNVGPGISKVGPVMNFHPFSALSKLVFCFDMLIGRLEIFPYLLLLSPELWRRRF